MADRVQKILARAGLGSRRQAEEMVRDGRVTVNGQVAELGTTADPETDAVKVDGRRVSVSRGPHRYLLVNKPRNVVSTVSDPEGRPAVIALVPQSYRRGLFPVGRLDFDSEGLMLLTDDGDLAQHVAHPRYGCGKTYEVKVRGVPDEVALDKLRNGVVLDGRRTAPAEISRRSGIRGSRDATNSTWWRVILREGRTRQIRQMFLRIGHSVMRLRRVAVGPIRDSELRPGDWRELSEAEVALLRRITAKPKSRVATNSRPRRARSAAGGVGAPRSARPSRGGAPRTAGPRSGRPARSAGSARTGTGRAGSVRSARGRGGAVRGEGAVRGARGANPRSRGMGSGSPRGASGRGGSAARGARSARGGSPRQSTGGRPSRPRSTGPRSSSPRGMGPRGSSPRSSRSRGTGPRSSSPRGMGPRGTGPRSSSPRKPRGPRSPRRGPRRGGGR